MTTDTGIEVHASWSDYMKEMAHLAVDVGLAWTGKMQAAWLKVRLTLDGKVVADEDLFAPHVVPCAPGQHTFGITFHRPGFGTLTALLGGERKITLTVQPGKITQLLFVQHRFNVDNELLELGAWPAVDPSRCETAKIVGSNGAEHAAKVLYHAQGKTLVQFPSGWRHWVDDATLHAG